MRLYFTNRHFTRSVFVHVLLYSTGKDILFLKVLFIIWICISIKTANDQPLMVEAQGKLSSREVRQHVPEVCSSLMGRLRGPGHGVKSNQEGHSEGRLRPTSSVKNQDFYLKQPRLVREQHYQASPRGCSLGTVS